METEKIYIIIVNYNNSLLTIDCLKSLKRIEYTEYQIIIIDNSDTPFYVEEIEKELRELGISFVFFSEDTLNDSSIDDNNSKVVIIKQKNNLGFASANNIGIKYALKKNDFDSVLLLNNDTVVEKDFLSVLYEKRKKYGDALYSCKIKYFDSPDNIWYGGGIFNRITGKCRHIIIKDEVPICKVTFITFCLVLIPRKIIDKVGLLDDSYFMYSEDLDYCYRTMRNKFSMYYVPESVIYHKVGASSNTTNKVSLFSARLGYKNELKFNKRRTDFLKYFSLFIIIFSRPIICIRWLLRKRYDLAKVSLTSIPKGLFYDE